MNSTPSTTRTTVPGSPKVLYWASTIFTALTFAAIGTANLLRAPGIPEGMAHLGYPGYFAMLLGVWELLGSVMIVVPGPRRLKEWAYAGMFFTLTGAAISHAVSGDPFGKIVLPIVLIVTVMASRALQPSRFARVRPHVDTTRGVAQSARVDLGGVEAADRSFVHRCDR